MSMHLAFCSLISLCQFLHPRYLTASKSTPSVISAGLHVLYLVYPSSKRLCLYLSHNPSSYPPSRLFSFSLLALGWSAAWGFKDGLREGGLAKNWKEGGRRHERKELERARGREAMQAGEGWARERKHQNVKQWSGCSCHHQGKGGRSAKTWRGREKNRRERKRESLLTWPQGALTSLILSPTLYHFLHQLPTHKTLIF